MSKNKIGAMQTYELKNEASDVGVSECGFGLQGTSLFEVPIPIFL